MFTPLEYLALLLAILALLAIYGRYRIGQDQKAKWHAMWLESKAATKRPDRKQDHRKGGSRQ